MVEDQGNVIIEGSDYLNDIASKRQRRGVADFEAQKVLLKDADEDYKVFVEELLAYANGGKGNTQTKSSSNSQEQIVEDWLQTENTESAVDSDVGHGVTENESGKGVDGDESEMVIFEEEDDYDPDYKVFFQNLEDRGHSYVLEISRKNCTLIANYEDNELSRKVPKSNPSGRNAYFTWRRNQLLRELRYLNASRCQLQGNRNSSRYRAKSTNCAQRNYRYCSTNTRKRKAGDKEKNKTSLRKKARKTIVEDETSDDLEDETSDDLEEPSSQRRSRVVTRNLSRRRGALKEYPPEKRRKGENYKERVQPPLLQKKDKFYSMFVSGLKMVGVSTVYTDKDGNQYRYEECTDEHTSDPDAQALALPPPSSNKMTPKPSNKRLRPSASNKMTPKPSKKRIRSSDKKAPSKQMVVRDLSYREKLMEILLKPYDPKEHRDLLKEAKLRRPVLHHKDMRSQNCSFPDEVEVDRSYLDRYGTLNTEIKAAERDDPHKVLLHLRGLFFYLQHACMEGNFTPWNDKSWLEAVNRSTSKQTSLTDSK